ncbi:MAG TPA: response regulator, partial [Candidatus Deferrimicrobium sp.]|nr:response regulator [Candidatus Deferrimicrobium sp.]
FNRAPAYISFRFPARSEITASAPVASHRATVLAIDDQPVILDLISAMCRSLGYEALTASTGEEGVIIASRRAVDIVLVDLAMPGISGLEVARRIRAISPEVPIVLVTGWEASISHSELQQAGISQVLNKPFRIEQLTEIFQSAIASPSVL